MPQERLPMRKTRDVLRLSANGLSKRKIAVSLGLSATAAGDCIRRAREAGVAWPLAAELTEAALTSAQCIAAARRSKLSAGFVALPLHAPRRSRPRRNGETPLQSAAQCQEKHRKSRL
jgi:hypothetical protein